MAACFALMAACFVLMAVGSHMFIALGEDDEEWAGGGGGRNCEERDAGWTHCGKRDTVRR